MCEEVTPGSRMVAKMRDRGCVLTSCCAVAEQLRPERLEDFDQATVVL